VKDHEMEAINSLLGEEKMEETKHSESKVQVHFMGNHKDIKKIEPKDLEGVKIIDKTEKKDESILMLK